MSLARELMDLYLDEAGAARVAAQAPTVASLLEAWKEAFTSFALDPEPHPGGIEALRSTFRTIRRELAKREKRAAGRN